MSVLLGLLVSLLTSPVASAQRSVLRRPALHWVRGPGTESCVAPRTLAAAVEELVGPVLVRPAEAENSIEGQVEALPSGGLRVRLRVLKRAGDSGERVLEHGASDCAAITPAIVFVVAMMIDPGVAAHGLPPELLALLGAEVPEEVLLAEIEQAPRHDAATPLPELSDAPEASSPPEPKTVAPRAQPRVKPVPQARDEEVPQRARAREDLGVQAALLVRLSLREAAGPLWSGEERMLFELRRPLSLAAHVRGGAQAGEYAFEEGRTIRIAVIAAGLALCAGHTGTAVLRLNGCLGGEVSGALARGAGLTEQRASFRTDGAVVAQLTARLRVYRQWGFGVFVNGRLSLVRRRFTYEDMDRVRKPAYTMERPSISFAVGPTYEF